MIERLADEALEVRDQATRDLIAAGPAEAPRLLEGFGPLTASEKARRLYTFAGIHLEHQQQLLDGATRRFDLAYRGELPGALRALSHASGAFFAFLVGERKGTVDLELRDVTLLDALDRVCAAVQSGWRRDRYGTVLLDGAPAPGPACYHGPCRARLTSVRVERATDFQSRSVSALLRLRIELEWPLNPMMSPVLKLREVALRPGGRVAARVETVTAADGSAEHLCTLDRLPPDAVAIERLDGAVVALFPTRFEEISIDSSMAGRQIEHQGFVVRIEEIGADRVIVSAESRGISDGDVSQEMLGELVSNVVLGIDTAGNEALAQVSVRQAQRDSSSTPRLRWRYAFERPGFSSLASVRLRIAKEGALKSFPIELEEIALP
jgi:hypothetical protein